MATKTTRRNRRRRGYAVDFHAHIVLPEAVAFAARHGMVREVSRMVRSGMLPTIKAWEQGKLPLTKVRNKGQAAAIRMVDPALQLKDMDDRGVDISVLSASLIHQCTYRAGADAALGIEKKTNDRMAAFIAHAPDRFVGLGSVPMQSVPKAVAELKRCMTGLGLKGVQISSIAGRRELGDPALDRFWQTAEGLGAVIFIHPSGVLDARFAKHQLWNSVGQPLEETMAMSSLIHEGVIDRFPKLKICMAHGGGYLPFYTGRADRNYRDKPFTRGPMTMAPSAYLRKFHYESCIYNPDMLEYLVGKVGAGRIVMGSDYPVGESDPVGFVRRARGISREAKEKILWRNASRLLGLSL